MKAITKKWRKWIVLPLAVVLVLGTILVVQMNRTPSPVYASGIAATSVTLTGQNTSSHYTYVQFNIAWDYSWRDDVNWDAAWVFVKYRVKTGEATYGNWAHATLNTSGHTAPSGSTITTSADGKGVFIYRSANGTGSVSWTGVQLRWNYGTDGVADSAIVQVKVFAIEMVYIPQGAFSLNSGAKGTMYAEFTSGNTISSENAIPENTITWAVAESTWSGAGDSGGTSGYNAALGASYPKGYQAIYCMKYEISQRQYAAFLNTLTSTQASNCYPNNYGYYRHYIKLVGGVYGCDANNNGVLDESNDGGWTACNFLSWAYGLAYADWAGLRPMTELEFEKICRGPGAAGDEYAWGTTNIVQATGISNANQNNETSSNGANAVYDGHASVLGPLRCGWAAGASTTREQAGASYYGVMEMSGNLVERAVTVAKYAWNGSTWNNATNAGAFDGQHGDGNLDSDGFANVSNWPSPTATSGNTALGSSARGGDWGDYEYGLRVSDRGCAALPAAARSSRFSFRLVRTSP
ncbi:MAG: hypothetical protein FJ006_07265 [Chloroflexi bacterium]|nr:hypothetical protein [Chloroflexota bacterium]